MKLTSQFTHKCRSQVLVWISQSRLECDTVQPGSAAGWLKQGTVRCTWRTYWPFKSIQPPLLVSKGKDTHRYLDYKTAPQVLRGQRWPSTSSHPFPCNPQAWKHRNLLQTRCNPPQHQGKAAFLQPQTQQIHWCMSNTIFHSTVQCHIPHASMVWVLANPFQAFCQYLERINQSSVISVLSTPWYYSYHSPATTGAVFCRYYQLL